MMSARAALDGMFSTHGLSATPSVLVRTIQSDRQKNRVLAELEDATMAFQTVTA